MFAAATLTLSACGGAPSTSGNSTAPTKAAAAGFNATDACALLPKEKVGAITGLKVDSATLSRVTPGTAETAGFSQCSYGFAGGGSVEFFARQSPVDDNTPEAIQQTRQNVGPDPRDVPGLGTAAFSVETMHQLHVFFAGNRYIYFMSMRAPAGKPVADIELALARAVVG